MKTAIIYNEIPLDQMYYLVDGDYSHLDGAQINAEGFFLKEQQACDFLFHSETGCHLHTPVTQEKFRQALLDPETKLAVINYYL